MSHHKAEGPASPFSLFFRLVRRDVSLAFKAGGIAPLALGFFTIALSLYPFGFGSDPNLLARTGAAVIWVTALFSTLLSLDRLFQIDLEDGTLAQYALSPLSPLLLVIAKVTAHWISSLLPLVLLSPVAAILFNLGVDQAQTLGLTLLVGTPALSLIGALIAGITSAVKRAGALITLLVLPLYIPTLIFGVGAIEAQRLSLEHSPAFLYLGITSLIAALVAPFLTQFTLKAALE